MSGRVEKMARRAAEVFEGRFDEAFEEQKPRWCAALIYFAEGIPIEKILKPYIDRWRNRKLAKGNADYKRHGMKVLAHDARQLMRTHKK